MTFKVNAKLNDMSRTLEELYLSVSDAQYAASLYLLGSPSQAASTARTVLVSARGYPALQNLSGSGEAKLDKNTDIT